MFLKRKSGDIICNGLWDIYIYILIIGSYHGILYVMEYGIYIYINGIIGIDNWILSWDPICNGIWDIYIYIH